MAKVRRFEELICWQKARQLANMVYDLAGQARFAGDYRLRDQIQGAAGSVMHNIAEGNDAGTDPEFVRFLKIARRSCSEIQSELYLALDRRYITKEELGSAQAVADEAKRLINGLIAYLRHSQPFAEAAGQIREVAQPYRAAVGLTDESAAVQLSSHDYETDDEGLRD